MIHAQLEEVIRDLDAVSQRARQLVAFSPDHRFHQRPVEGKWSAAECLEHLNLTTQAYLPLIDNALRSAPRMAAENILYKKDLLGRLMSWMMEPRSGLRVRTTAPFQPQKTAAKEELLDVFLALQVELTDRVRQSAGKDLNSIRVVSAFNRHVTYNLYSTFKILAAHERRHVTQAESAVKSTL
jgi:hypothetical protein